MKPNVLRIVFVSRLANMARRGPRHNAKWSPNDMAPATINTAVTPSKIAEW